MAVEREFTPGRAALAMYEHLVGRDESNIADLIADLILIAEVEHEDGGEAQIFRGLGHYLTEKEA